MRRLESKRFKFDVENYLGHDRKPMKHVRVYCRGAMQTDLWLDHLDVQALQDALDEDRRDDAAR